MLSSFIYSILFTSKVKFPCSNILFILLHFDINISKVFTSNINRIRFKLICRVQTQNIKIRIKHLYYFCKLVKSLPPKENVFSIAANFFISIIILSILRFGFSFVNTHFFYIRTNSTKHHRRQEKSFLQRFDDQYVCPWLYVGRNSGHYAPVRILLCLYDPTETVVKKKDCSPEI